MGLSYKQKREARKRRQDDKRGGGWLRLEKFSGTLVYLAGPADGMEDCIFLDVDVHNILGPDKKMSICPGEDYDGNDLGHADVQALLREKQINVKPGDECEGCVEAEDPSLSEKDQKEKSAKSTAFFVAIPIARRKPNGEIERDAEGNVILLPLSERKPQILKAGTQLTEAICDVIDQVGNPCDPNAANLIWLDVPGDFKTAYYKAHAEVQFIRETYSLSKGEKMLLAKAREPGGTCCLYQQVARLAKTSQDIKALVRGIPVTTQSEGEGGDADPDIPSCFGMSTQIDSDDKECQKCNYKVDCAAKCGVEVPPDPKKRGSVSQKKPASEPETEEELESDGSSEDEPEETEKLGGGETEDEPEETEKLEPSEQGQEALNEFEAALNSRKS